MTDTAHKACRDLRGTCACEQRGQHPCETMVQMARFMNSHPDATVREGEMYLRAKALERLEELPVGGAAAWVQEQLAK